MTKVEQAVVDLCEASRERKSDNSPIYKGIVWNFSRRVEKELKFKNPLYTSIMISDIKEILEVIHPAFDLEIIWFNKLSDALKLWSNEQVIVNRLLGIKNDNYIDVKVMDELILECFKIPVERWKKMNERTPVETDIGTIRNLVEMGIRRY
jgi:hypothetical protein